MSHVCDIQHGQISKNHQSDISNMMSYTNILKLVRMLLQMYLFHHHYSKSCHFVSIHQWGRKHCLHQNHVVRQFFVRLGSINSLTYK
jgi:hypothetical protein